MRAPMKSAWVPRFPGGNEKGRPWRAGPSLTAYFPVAYWQVTPTALNAAATSLRE